MATGKLRLKRDITAEYLAMDAPAGEEGYPASHVIGPKGSTVRVIARDNEQVEVTDFANDPYAAGYVHQDDLEVIPTSYCTLCGNEEVEGTDQIGPLCQPWIEGPMQMAYEAMVFVRENWGAHCPASLGGTFAFGRSHEERIRKFGKDAAIRLHPNSYGEASFQPEYADKPLMYVECGVRFGLDAATCYWIFDNDTIGLTEGHDLDTGSISYTQDGESFLPS